MSERGRLELGFVERLLESVVCGTTAVLKSPLLLVGLMILSLLVKRFAAPNSED